MRALIRKLIFPLLQAAARPFFALLLLRGLTNAVMLPMGFTLQFYIHKVFGRTFRRRAGEPAPGVWRVRFCGQVIRMPLRRGYFWLDWETAVSILGHEHFIKAKYAAILASTVRPTLFVDVGANFGTHSLLFLSQGIPALSFEPNPQCEPYFREACAINGYQARWHATAIGDSRGEIELVFPEHETWVGTIVKDEQTALAALGKLELVKVALTRLDDFADQFVGQRVWVKIDTEGAELFVLRGANEILSTHQPYLLFECNPGSRRAEVFDELARHGYTLTDMGWIPDAPAVPLSREAFIGSTAADFIALPPH